MAGSDRLGEVSLEIQGLGILLYSPFAASQIAEGEDYLESFTTSDQVLPHVYAGDLVAFGTGSPGTFILEFRAGYPDDAALAAAQYKLRLGVEVRDQTLCARDLYDLLDWTAECPREQQITIGEGFYHVTLFSNRPTSGTLGDDQRVIVCLNRLDAMPRLKFDGVPTLCA